MHNFFIIILINRNLTCFILFQYLVDYEGDSDEEEDEDDANMQVTKKARIA